MRHNKAQKPCLCFIIDLQMAYLDDKLTLLYKQIEQGRIFTVDDVAKILEIKKSSAYWILYNLVKESRLDRVGRGYYKIPSQELQHITSHPIYSELAARVVRAFEKEGLKFYVTGLDILSAYFNQIPASYPPLIYVEKGSSDWAARLLSELGEPFIIAPHAGEISVARSVLKTKDPIIIRETAEFNQIYQSAAMAEKAFVDLYYEITRGFYEFPLGELAHILVNFFLQGGLNPVQMISAARRRRINKEIRYILDQAFGTFHEISRPTIALSPSAQLFVRNVRQLRNMTAHGQSR